LAAVGVLTLVLIAGDDACGQRGGFRGGAAARGGAVVGPYGGGGAAARSRGTVVGPYGGSRSVGSTAGSYTTARGSTINYAGAGRTATGPGGVTAGRGVGGVSVTTPSGQTYSRAVTAGGVRGPAGYGVAGGRSVGATSGPYGAGVSASRGGVAVGPGGAMGGYSRAGVGVGPGGAVGGYSRGGAVVGPRGGYVGGASHWSAASNPYGAYPSASRGVAVAGGVGVGHYTAYRGAGVVRAQAGYVRTGFRGWNYFNTGWYTAHPGAWRAAAWTGANYWRWAPYATVATFCSYPAEPVIYDYGSAVVYQDNSVYYNGDPIATAEEYATQALDVASVGLLARPPEKEEWLSLGVFGMIQGEEKETNDIFQLAVNKDGVIRGNYYNALTDSSLPVYGSVDAKSQRAAWIVGENKTTVYETGFGNLSQAETSMLVHFGKDRTQQWMLVRLEAPADAK
jgi:hypothetical protein